MHNLGRNQSEKARKEIEREFGLVHAQQQQKADYNLKPVNAQKVQYGKAETKRAVTNVLDYVLPNYKYASLAELNAVLKQYNVIADRGSESSRIYQSRGLVYRILDNSGEKIGVPIKASLIYSKPTLRNIEARFERNERERQRHKQRIMNAVDFAVFKKTNQSLAELTRRSKKKKFRLFCGKIITVLFTG